MPERDPIERMALAHRSAPEGTSSPIERMLAAVRELKAIADELYNAPSPPVLDAWQLNLALSRRAIAGIIHNHKRRLGGEDDG